MVSLKIEIDLPFEHCCKDCNHFCLEYRTDFKAVPLRQVISKWIHGKKVEWNRARTIVPNWCNKHKVRINPNAKESCFVWTGSHEEWIPDIEATIVDGTVKVIVE